jgi:hypothetical protein
MVKKMVGLLGCFLLAFGCARVDTKMTNKITVAPAAERTICIQTDPAKSETALIIKPIEEKVASMGYKIVSTPGEAAYTMRLDSVSFGWTASPARNYARAGVGSAAGTAVGGAVSGNSLHATTTTGGFVGGLAGLGVGALFSGPGVSFTGKVEVSITDSAKYKQQTLLTAWTRVANESRAQKAVANKLAAKIAALLP